MTLLYVCLGVIGLFLVLLWVAKAARRKKVARTLPRGTRGGGEPIPQGSWRSGRPGWNFGKLILPLVVIVLVVYWMKSYARQGNGSKIQHYTYAPANGDVLPKNQWTSWTLAVYQRGEEPHTPTGGYPSPAEGASFLSLGRYNLDSLKVIDCTSGDTLHFQCWGINHQISSDAWLYLRNGDFDWVVGSGHFPFGAIAAGTEYLEGWVVRDNLKKGSIKLKKGSIKLAFKR